MLSEGKSIKKYLLKARYQWDPNIGLPMNGNNLNNDDEWYDELQPDDDVLDSVEGRLNDLGVNEDEESEEFYDWNISCWLGLDFLAFFRGGGLAAVGSEGIHDSLGVILGN